MSRSVGRRLCRSANECVVDSYATPLAVGLVSDDQTPEAYTFVLSMVLKVEGCDVFRSTLANAYAFAVADGHEHLFAAAVDFDI